MKDNYSNELMELLLYKKYEELTIDEKRQVLSEMDEQEYMRISSLNQCIPAALNFERSEVKPDALIKEKVLNAYKNKNKKHGIMYWLQSFLQYKIPAYQVATAFCILILAFWKLEDEQVKINPVITNIVDTVLVTKIDTIFLESPTTKSHLIAYNDSNPVSDSSDSAIPTRLLSTGNREYNSRSLADDSTLKSFFAVIP